MSLLFEKRDDPINDSTEKDNYDNLQAAILHYLCVLVKDSVLREDMLQYSEAIMVLAFEKFTSREWKIRNAALQLFGGLIPKLLGQKQYSGETELNWEPVQISLYEIIDKMPKVNKFILEKLNQKTSDSLLILFLEYLSKIEVRKYNFEDARYQHNIHCYRERLYRLLGHRNEKVRDMSAKVFALFNEFRSDILISMDVLINMFFNGLNNFNFMHGAIKAITYMIRKYQSDIRYIDVEKVDLMERLFGKYIKNNNDVTLPFIPYYIRTYLIDLLLSFNKPGRLSMEIVFCSKDINDTNIVDTLKTLDNDKLETDSFGYALWRSCVEKVYNL